MLLNMSDVLLRLKVVSGTSEFSLVIVSPTVLSVSLDFNSKLQGLLNELRGEIGAVLRGNKDAKDRLLKSEFNDAPVKAVTLKVYLTYFLLCSITSPQLPDFKP